MPSQTFSYWDKQQSADSNIIQLYLTLKRTTDNSSHLQRLFRSFELNRSPPNPSENIETLHKTWNPSETSM